MPNQTCSKCGAGLTPGGSFCGVCGTPVADVAAAPQADPAGYPPPAPSWPQPSATGTFEGYQAPPAAFPPSPSGWPAAAPTGYPPQAPAPTGSFESYPPASTTGSFESQPPASATGSFEGYQPASTTGSFESYQAPPFQQAVAPAQPSSPPSNEPVYVRPVSASTTPVNPLVGAPSPNETYTGMRLTFQDQVTDFDPVSNGSVLAALKARTLAITLAWFAGSLLLFLVFGIAGIAQIGSGSIYSGRSGSSGLLTTWAVFWLIWSLLLAIIFWFSKVPAQVSEWMISIDGKGSAALSALEHMHAIIRARETPTSEIRVVQASAAGLPPRDYLELRFDRYLNVVSCFAYGSDLYLGWTMWITISPFRWIVLMLGRMLRTLTGRQSTFRSFYITDTAKAMREVVHSAVRQGVDLATGRIDPVGQGTFGYTVQVEAV